MDQGMFIIVVVVAFLLLSVVPQIVQRRRHEQELSGLHKGLWVMTIGGIVGQIKEIGPEYVKLRISKNGELSVALRAIRGRVPPLESFEEASEDEEGSEES